MVDQNPVLSILQTFESFLNSLSLSFSQKDNIFQSYFDLRILLQQPSFDRKQLNDFFLAYKTKNFNQNPFDESESFSSFSKPQNFIEKVVTFQIDIDNFPLYDSPSLKTKFNFTSPYQKIRSFTVDSSNLSFFRCIAFAHIEHLIKSRSAQKLLNYSKIKLSASNEFHELNDVLTSNLMNIISLIQNPTYTEEMLNVEFIKKINIYPSKFLDSLIFLIKSILISTIEDPTALNFFNISLSQTERTLILNSLQNNQNYVIPYSVKQVMCCILNLNLSVLNILPNQEPFTEKITSKLENPQNVHLVYFEKPDYLYTIGYGDNLFLSQASLSNKSSGHNNNIILSRAPSIKKTIMENNIFSMPMRKDEFEVENTKNQEKNDLSKLKIRSFKEFDLPSESQSLTTTPKPKPKEDPENNFELSIPSEKKNAFKIDYQYEELGKKNKLLQEQVIFFMENNIK